jgi:hemerythrin
MQRLHWTAENSVFESEVDAEHRELFRLGEDLRRTSHGGAGVPAIRQATRVLIAEVEAHFAHEERLMRSARYSGYAWHKRQHDSALRRLRSLAGQPDDLLPYLAAWLHDHAAVADRMMAASLRNAGRGRTTARAS